MKHGHVVVVTSVGQLVVDGVLQQSRQVLLVGKTHFTQCGLIQFNSINVLRNLSDKNLYRN